MNYLPWICEHRVFIHMCFAFCLELIAELFSLVNMSWDSRMPIQFCPEIHDDCFIGTSLLISSTSSWCTHFLLKHPKPQSYMVNHYIIFFWKRICLPCLLHLHEQVVHSLLMPSVFQIFIMWRYLAWIGLMSVLIHFHTFYFWVNRALSWSANWVKCLGWATKNFATPKIIIQLQTHPPFTAELSSSMPCTW